MYSFYEKIKSNVAKAAIVLNGVYSGKNKLIVQNRNFMTRRDVEICMADLNTKKCEGYDRIPVCSIWDARVTLLDKKDRTI